MVRIEQYYCDKCDKRFTSDPKSGVTNVQCTVGGNGAAADVFTADLCRDCYIILHSAIRAGFGKNNGKY